MNGKHWPQQVMSKVAFEMLDVNKEGVLGKKQAHVAPRMFLTTKWNTSTFFQARDFLRCAGWCVPDDELDAMLVGRASSGNLVLLMTSQPSVLSWQR